MAQVFEPSIGFMFLSLFSTAFMCLTLYQRFVMAKSAHNLPTGISIILIPLVVLYLYVFRGIADAIIAGVLIAAIEFIHEKVGLKSWQRYGLWAVSMLASSGIFPMIWLIDAAEYLPESLLLFALWFISTLAIVQYSGKRYYDAYLMPLFVFMHVLLIWLAPNIPDHLGNDVAMLGLVILAYAVWREAGGNLDYDAPLLGFASVWIAYIWLQMAQYSAVPAIFILVAYPVMSRLIGRFDRSRQLVQDKRGNVVLMVGSVFILVAAYLTTQDQFVNDEQDWMIVFGSYILVIVAIVSNRHDVPLSEGDEVVKKFNA